MGTLYWQLLRVYAKVSGYLPADTSACSPLHCSAAPVWRAGAVRTAQWHSPTARCVPSVQERGLITHRPIHLLCLPACSLVLDVEAENTAISAASSEKEVYCLTSCLGCCSNSAMLGFPLAIAARLPVCRVAFSGCWCMLISKMFVANQSIANCNQTLFSKLAKLFSHTEFIIAIKRVMTFLTLTLKYLKSLPVICCYDKLWSEYWESSVQADTLAHVHLNYSSRLIYKEWGLGVSLEYTICLNLSGRWLTLLFAPDKSVWVVCKNEISLLKTII